MSFGDGNLRARIDHLEEVNGELCAEINRQERVIERLSSGKVYAVDTWSDLDDIGQHYVERRVYRSKDAAIERAEQVRAHIDCGVRYYAAVYEFEVVDADGNVVA